MPLLADTDNQWVPPDRYEEGAGPFQTAVPIQKLGCNNSRIVSPGFAGVICNSHEWLTNIIDPIA
jgi:hypothetical protein